MKNIFLLSIISFLLVNCTSQKTLNSLNNGMDKAEVIKILGKPETSSSDGKFVYMKYLLKKSTFNSDKNAYFVKLLDNKVNGYGLMSDLNKNEINNNSPKKTLTEDEAFFELKKSKDLLGRGIITKEEYETIKKKLLNN